MATDRLTGIFGSSAPHIDIITRMSGTAVSDSIAVDRMTGLGGFSTGAATDVFTGLSGYSGTLIADRMTRLSGKITTSVMTVSLGADRSAEPLEIVFINVSFTGSPETLTVAQTGGPSLGVAFPGNPGLSNPSPNVWQYVAPATQTGVTLTFTATATRVGATTVTDSVVHTIHRHTMWMYNSAGTLVPRFMRKF